MIPRRYGRIINLGSQAGFVALPTESVYCMTKAAIAHLTKCLALEWATHNIIVIAVAPTFIRTPGTQKWLDDENFRVRDRATSELGRLGDAAEPFLRQAVADRPSVEVAQRVSQKKPCAYVNSEMWRW